MNGQNSETLTAALRRLADERASGLLSVTTPTSDVIIELTDGEPVAMGPVHDVSGRVGDGAPAALVTTAVVDELVDRAVAAVVASDASWAWDVSTDADLVKVPDGLTKELARRAVDAAQALAALDPDDVLEPAHAVTTTGELDRVRQLFDGARTLRDVAATAALTVPTVATMAAALVAAGALARDGEDADEPGGQSWTDTVAAADDDEDDDEPELWVMDPPDDEVVEAEPDEEPGDEEESEAEDDTWVAPAEDDADPPTGNWNDTSWLEELVPSDEADDATPVPAGGGADPSTALSSLLEDLQDDEELHAADPTDQDSPPDEAADAGDRGPGGDPVPPARRREPKAEPGDVAEFLRELSRLALDDD